MSKLSRRRALQGGVAAALAAPFFACTASKTRSARSLIRVVDPAPHTDGAGVKLKKLLGGRALPMMDPFLMLDEFHSSNPDDFVRGFPNHPHRGFETVSIVLDGHVDHKDSVGNHGDISKDGVQWMTAGRGIVHAEMPRASAETGALWGFQLWVNLPAAKKWSAPRYQDLHADAFTTTMLDDARVRVLAGKVGAVRGPIEGVAVDPTLLDVRLDAGARCRQVVPRGHAAFLVVAEGSVAVGEAGDRVVNGQLGVLGPGEELDVTAMEAARFLVFAGQPIGEPVARRGPFVMNTDDEIRQAYDDYRAGRLGNG